MLGLKLNHVSKSGYWCVLLSSIYIDKMCCNYYNAQVVSVPVNHNFEAKTVFEYCNLRFRFNIYSSNISGSQRIGVGRNISMPPPKKKKKKKKDVKWLRYIETEQLYWHFQPAEAIAFLHTIQWQYCRDQSNHQHIAKFGNTFYIYFLVWLYYTRIYMVSKHGGIRRSGYQHSREYGSRIISSWL